MAHTVMAYIVMAHIVMTYTVMVYISSYGSCQLLRRDVLRVNDTAFEAVLVKVHTLVNTTWRPTLLGWPTLLEGPTLLGWPTQVANTP